jgi:hypothetical protein
VFIKKWRLPLICIDKKNSMEKFLRNPKISGFRFRFEPGNPKISGFGVGFRSGYPKIFGFSGQVQVG